MSFLFFCERVSKFGIVAAFPPRFYIKNSENLLYIKSLDYFCNKKMISVNCSPLHILVEKNKDLFGDFHFHNEGNASNMLVDNETYHHAGECQGDVGCLADGWRAVLFSG